MHAKVLRRAEAKRAHHTLDLESLENVFDMGGECRRRGNLMDTRKKKLSIVGNLRSASLFLLNGMK